MSAGIHPRRNPPPDRCGGSEITHGSQVPRRHPVIIRPMPADRNLDRARRLAEYDSTRFPSAETSISVASRRSRVTASAGSGSTGTQGSCSAFVYFAASLIVDREATGELRQVSRGEPGQSLLAIGNQPVSVILILRGRFPFEPLQKVFLGGHMPSGMRPARSSFALSARFKSARFKSARFLSTRVRYTSIIVRAFKAFQ